MPPGHRTILLERKLQRWHIFFIAIGGVIGVGFFQGVSKTLGVSGPGGALMATVIVGLIAMAVMEGICHLICVWPISNAMVEFVKAFVDEDLGTAIGILYWSTYCITFSVLIASMGSLTDYWGAVYARKTGVFIAAPILLLMINAAPVRIFGWIELAGGVVKIALVLGISLLMLVLNLGVGYGPDVGTTFINDAVQHNSNVASGKFVAVSASIPPAIFAYIGVELLTTTAFEARDPREMRLPARNIGWISTMLYALSAGTFISNVSWTDQNLPQLFSQALTMATDSRIVWDEPTIDPNVHAAPLIFLLRAGWRFLPSFINGCLMYSAFSCANTALYVASRQLHGLTRTITVTGESNFVRSFLGWLGTVDYRTKSPWPALFVSVLVLYWLPFTKRQNNYQAMEDLQTVLAEIGSVSCMLVWCSQCIAYIHFYRLRLRHENKIDSRPSLRSLLDKENTGYGYVFQPYLSWLAAIATLAIVFFFNTASLWNGERLVVKAIGAFTSPGLLLLVYLVKKFTRPRRQWRSRKDLTLWSDFEQQVSYLQDLVFPLDHDVRSEAEVELTRTTIEVKTEAGAHPDFNTSSAGGTPDEIPTVAPPRQTLRPWEQESLDLIPHSRDQIFAAPLTTPANANMLQISQSHTSQLDELDATNTTANNTGIALTTTMHSLDESQPNQDTTTTTDPRTPNSPTNRYYDGRTNLSPHDARTYSQPQTQRPDAEFSGSNPSPHNTLISPLTSPGLTPVQSRTEISELGQGDRPNDTRDITTNSSGLSFFRNDAFRHDQIPLSTSAPASPHNYVPYVRRYEYTFRPGDRRGSASGGVVRRPVPDRIGSDEAEGGGRTGVGPDVGGL